MVSKRLSTTQLKSMGYVDFMALLDETNRPPGGLESLLVMLQNTFVTKESQVLDVGCNTGYCSFEISRLIECAVTGVDINTNMIATANRNKNIYLDSQRARKVNFIVGDAKKLAFPDNSFDLVMSGGSTAFVDDIPAAIREYVRVCKDYGFMCDINFYYHTPPPQKLINKMNATMGTNIQPWDSSYWEKIYQVAGLERINILRKEITQVSDEKVLTYAKEMAERLNVDTKATTIIEAKLRPIMELFNENHRYLAAGVYIYRKNPHQYETALF